MLFQDADEDELEEDELPEWKREPPKVDMSKLDPKDPEGMLKMSKKGRTLMLFATVSGKYCKFGNFRESLIFAKLRICVVS